MGVKVKGGSKVGNLLSVHQSFRVLRGHNKG